MPENKVQHYVPKCYLRNFGAPRGGAALNLFNVSRKETIRNAPIKGQCARPYFYGKDRELEKAFHGPEGILASRTKKAIEDAHRLTVDEIADLRDLALLQTFRSYGFIERQMARVGEQAADLKAAGATDDLLKTLVLDRDATLMLALAAYEKVRPSIEDLDGCLVVNNSRVDFITSDDPAIHTNRYHIQKGRAGGFGFGSSGAMLIMPLSPRTLLLCFDPHVYRVVGRLGHVAEIDRDDDAIDFNRFQVLHARHNLYFRDWEQRAAVTQAFDADGAARPVAWHEIHYFEEEVAGTGRFKRVDGLRPPSSPGLREMMMHHVTQVRPKRWPKVLAYKLRQEVVDTGGGAGHMRPHSHMLDVIMSRRAATGR